MKTARLLCFHIFCLTLATCAASLSAADINITDAAGRTHTLPGPVSRVYTTSPVGAIFVYTIAPETLVGWNYKPSEHELAYMTPETRKLPVVGGWFGKNGTANLETLLATKPDVIISIGSIGKTDFDFADRIEKQTNIPVIVADGGLDKSPEVYELLGKLFDKPELAAELGGYCQKTFEDVAALAAKIPEDDRISVYYAEGLKGLETDSSASMHTQSINIAGGKNVCRSGEDSMFGRALVSMEQVLLWQPELVFIGRDRGDADTLPEWMSDKEWRRLPAFVNKRVYQIPNSPFNWMDRPPAVNRIIGIRWAFWCMYPDRADFDMTQETINFYHLFYHYEMSAEEAGNMLSQSKLEISND